MRFDFTDPDQEKEVYTVAELNREVRELLEDRYGGVWVEAEVTEASSARSGHLYFVLSDLDGKAMINAVMWQGPAMRYGSRIKPGLAIRCHGRVTVYEAKGSYQLVVDRAEEAGAGIKAQKLAKLKKKLEDEGLFLAEHKRALPPFPSCIGVVTSRSGAAIRDIVKIAGRRFPVRIVLAHAQVQGARASAEIVKALDALGAVKEVDVVIVGRGGGSSEDLDAFNAEEVVRAVYRHPKPVVSAVGHETDITLVDLVADIRAATPSEAAEVVLPDREALLENLLETRRTIARSVKRRAGKEREKLAIQLSRLSAHDPRVRLKRAADILARCRESLARWPALALSRARAELAAAGEPIVRWPKPALAQARGELARLAAGLEALSPLASLSRGYSVVRRSADGAIVRSSDQAPVGTELDIVLARGELGCVVHKTKPGGQGC